MPEHSLQMTGDGKPFLYLPQAFVDTLDWEKGDAIRVDLVSVREGEQELRLRGPTTTDPASERPVLEDSEGLVRVDVDGEVVNLKRSFLESRVDTPWYEVPALRIMQKADVEFPEEKLLVAADGNKEWGQDASVDLREHRRFDVREKPDFGGG